MAAAYLDEGREIGSPPARFYATGRLEVVYRRPTPIAATLELEADIVERGERSYSLDCRLSAAGKVCATARVEAIAVPDAWMGLTEPAGG